MNRIVVQSYEEVLAGVPPDKIPLILSPEDIQKASRFYHKDDHDRFVAARILLWQELQVDQALVENLELPLRLDYNEYGKPGLSNFPITFNWSHSGNLISLIVGEAPCGVDIELNNTKPLFDIDSLCTPLELDWLTRLIGRGGYTKKEGFLNLWTAKEAALKALGTGLSVDPRHVEIVFLDDQPNEWITTIDGTELVGGHRFMKHKSESYALAWCSVTRSCMIVCGNGIS